MRYRNVQDSAKQDKYQDMKAMQLEKHLFLVDEWDNHELPEEARIIAEEGSGEGISTAIGWAEDTGFFVLMTGQGPFVAWMENKDVEHRYRDA